MTLHEGDVAVNDFSALSYSDAFEPCTRKFPESIPLPLRKNLDWDALYETYAPRMAEAKDDEDFYWALKDYSLAIPDGHVGVGFNDLVAQLFFENYGGSFGLILAEIDAPYVIVTAVIPGSPAEEAGIEVGAEIWEWNGKAMDAAIAEVEPFFGPYSTEHHKRYEQLVFLTRVAPDDRVEIQFRNPGDEDQTVVEMKATVEYDSLFQWIPSFSTDELALPIEAEVLDGIRAWLYQDQHFFG